MAKLDAETGLNERRNARILTTRRSLRRYRDQCDRRYRMQRLGLAKGTDPA